MIRNLMFSIFICLFLISFIGISNISAQDGDDIHEKAGTSAFPFLKINISARAVAMGGAFTGLADDEASLYYNPAGIVTFEQESRYIIGYHNYFTDIQSGFAGYIRTINEKMTFGGYLSYLNYGKFTEANRFGEVTGDFSGGDLMGAATLAYRFNYNYAGGITIKAIYEKIQKYSAAGFAIDLGAKYIGDREKFTAGIMIQNLGKQLSGFGDEKYRMPLTVRTGIAIKPRGLPVQLSSDLIIPVDNDIVFAIGAEYYELEPIYFRLGWNSFGSNYVAEGSEDNLAGLSLGFGFDVRNMQVSYSFSPGADLGDSHRITLTGSM